MYFLFSMQTHVAYKNWFAFETDVTQSENVFFLFYPDTYWVFRCIHLRVLMYCHYSDCLPKHATHYVCYMLINGLSLPGSTHEHNKTVMCT